MKVKIYAIVIVLLLVSLTFTIVAYILKPNSTVNRNTVDSDSTQYPYLSTRVFSESPNDIFLNFMPLRQALREYISKQPETISLFFEYLPSGSSIGINDTDEIEMASLIKLPVVMAIYEKILENELRTDTMLTLEEKQINKKFGNFWQRGVGAKISLEDAIKMTIVESDNTTYEMLFDQLTTEERVKLFQQLDMRLELANDTIISYISAKSYASVLKSLYLSSYLPIESSNEILDLLSQSPRDGIAKDIDDNIIISHKTGMLEQVEKADVKNDCGIIYFPKRPYILCILVHGENEDTIEKHMNLLSEMIYEYINMINIVRAPEAQPSNNP